MNLNREINLNKKVIVFLILFSVIGISFYYSYALFQVDAIKHNAIILKTATSLDITTTIDDTGLDTFTLGNEPKTITVKLDTNGITSAMAYKMFYEITSGSGTFTVTSTETFKDNKVEGIMQPYDRGNNTKITGKVFTLTFTNNTSNTLTIKLGAIGGYETKGVLLIGKKSLLLNTNLSVENKILSYIVNNDTKLDTGIKFYEINGTNNGNGLFLRSGTENDEYPIYYYRGNVTNNNVKFAGYCWKIVRTTDTGGTKLLFNGAYTEENKCNNTGDDSQLEQAAFSTTVYGASMNSPAFVGYSYSSGEWWPNGTQISHSNYYFGKSVLSNMTLENPIIGVGDTYHHFSYSSNSSTATTITDENICYYNSSKQCISSSNYVKYFWKINGTALWHIYFPKTKNIDTVLYELLGDNSNTKDHPSNIQTIINNWWSPLNQTYGGYLEDTAWCADRSIYSKGGFNPNGGAYTGEWYDYGIVFNSMAKYNLNIFNDNPNRIDKTNTPELTCSNPNDYLTVANNKLTYPIALLTMGEGNLAGGLASNVSNENNNNFYLYNGNQYWLLSPSIYIGNGEVGVITAQGRMTSSGYQNNWGIRPALSLKAGIKISGGNGSPSSPYIIS